MHNAFMGRKLGSWRFRLGINKWRQLYGYKPWYLTLTRGGFLMSCLWYTVTSFSSTMLSNVQPLWALDISCFIAVRNPCGLKKPVIQNWAGFSLKTHVVIWLCRFRNSLNQNPIVDDVQETLRQCAGMRPSYK